jgi:hypothetical protein
VGINEFSDTPAGKPIWKLEAPGGSCAFVKELRYAHSNHGLNVKISPRQLAPGAPYEIWLSGWGGGGSRKFIFLRNEIREWTWRDDRHDGRLTLR